MGICLTTEVYDENKDCDDSPQVIHWSVADIARYMSHMKPADARLEVRLQTLP